MSLQYIHISPSFQKPTRRRRHSSAVFDKIDFTALSSSNPLSDFAITDLMQLIRVCCALKIQAHMYLTKEESEAILHLITCICPPFSPAGVKYVEVALSVLLACPFLVR